MPLQLRKICQSFFGQVYGSFCKRLVRIILKEENISFYLILHINQIVTTESILKKIWAGIILEIEIPK